MTMSDDLVVRLRSLADRRVRGYYTPLFITSVFTDAADRIEALEAERDALREALAPLMSWPGGIPKRWVADDEVSPIEAEALMTVRALLDPEDGER